MLLPYLQGQCVHKQDYISQVYVYCKCWFGLNSPMKYVMPETPFGLHEYRMDWWKSLVKLKYQTKESTWNNLVLHLEAPIRHPRIIWSYLTRRPATPKSRSSYTPSSSPRGSYATTSSHTWWRSWRRPLSVRSSKARTPREGPQSGHSSWWIRALRMPPERRSSPRCWLTSSWNGPGPDATDGRRSRVLDDVLRRVTDEKGRRRGAGLHITPRGPHGYMVRFHFPSSNNVAEYEALVNGLRIAIELGIQCLDIRGDSQLVVNQVMKESSYHDAKMAAY